MQLQSALLPHSGNQLQPLPLLDFTQNIPRGQEPSPHSLQPPAAHAARALARGAVVRGAPLSEDEASSVVSEPVAESSFDSVAPLESAELALAPPAPPPQATSVSHTIEPKARGQRTVIWSIASLLLPESRRARKTASRASEGRARIHVGLRGQAQAELLQSAFQQ
jgi:hypothetical protein